MYVCMYILDEKLRWEFNQIMGNLYHFFSGRVNSKWEHIYFLNNLLELRKRKKPWKPNGPMDWDFADKGIWGEEDPEEWNWITRCCEELK